MIAKVIIRHYVYLPKSPSVRCTEIFVDSGHLESASGLSFSKILGVKRIDMSGMKGTGSNGRAWINQTNLSPRIGIEHMNYVGQRYLESRAQRTVVSSNSSCRYSESTERNEELNTS